MNSNNKIVNLNKFKLTTSKSSKTLEILKEYKGKNIPLNLFVEETNFLIFEKTSKIIDKVKTQYSKDLNLNVVKMIAYLKNLNNSHNVFYNGFKLNLGFDSGLELPKEDFYNSFVDLGINSIFVEYRPNKDKNGGDTTNKEL